MTLLWRWITLRHWRRSPGTHVMLVLLLGTGVAAFLGVRLANRSAVAGFSLFTDALSGGPRASVRAESGSILLSQLRPIRQSFDSESVILLPFQVLTASLPSGEKVDLSGLDLLAARNLANLSPDTPPFTPTTQAQQESFAKSIQGEHILFPSFTASRSLGLSEGESLRLLTETGWSTWTLGATLPESADGNTLQFFADLSATLTVSGRADRVDRVDVFALDNTFMAASMKGALPTGLVMEGSGDRRATAASLSAAFRMNLSALSLLALLVSLYLILQALDAAVVRRRSEIAILRSLGVAPQHIYRAWLVEAFTLGVAGSFAGVVMGYGLARISVQAVTQTLGNLYVQGATRAALWSWGEVGAAFALGVGSSLLAGWLPARDAALTPPAQALGRSARALPIQLLDHPRYGLLALGLGVLCYPLPPLLLDGGRVRFPLFGYLSATFLAVGLSILACTLLPLAAQVLMRMRPHDARVRYAASQLRKPSGRHKLAMAGLLIATAMAGGITLLVHSFQGTVSGWLGEQLRADVFISARGFQHAGSTARIPLELRERLLQDPAIADREWSQIQRIPFAGKTTILAGIALPQAPVDRIWLTRPAGGLEVIHDPGDSVSLLASEPFVRKFGFGMGEELTFTTPSGPVTGRIQGVFVDYANEHGTLVTSAERMVEWFGEDRCATMGLYLKSGSDRQAVVDRLQDAYPSLNIRDQSSLRQEVFEIFRQTFSVTSALKGIGVAVAVAGLVLSQLSQFTERRGELRVLKELGATRRDIVLAGAWESTALVLVGSLTGLVAALLLGHILVYVINRQSFGWTLQYAIPWRSYAEYFVLILVAGVLTGGLTGGWASRLNLEKEE